jgi:hypothetical protein
MYFQPYLTTIPLNSDYVASNERISGELERMWKEAVVAYLKVLYRSLPRETSVKIACLRTDK